MIEEYFIVDNYRQIDIIVEDGPLHFVYRVQPKDTLAFKIKNRAKWRTEMRRLCYRISSKHDKMMTISMIDGVYDGDATPAPHFEK